MDKILLLSKYWQGNKGKIDFKILQQGNFVLDFYFDLLYTRALWLINYWFACCRSLSIIMRSSPVLQIECPLGQAQGSQVQHRPDGLFQRPAVHPTGTLPNLRRRPLKHERCSKFFQRSTADMYCIFWSYYCSIVVFILKEIITSSFGEFNILWLLARCTVTDQVGTLQFWLSY